MPRPGIFLMAALVEPDIRQTPPRIADIASGAPTISATPLTPFADLAPSILAQAVDNIAMDCVESGPHHHIGFLKRLERENALMVRAHQLAVTAPVVF